MDCSRHNTVEGSIEYVKLSKLTNIRQFYCNGLVIGISRYVISCDKTTNYGHLDNNIIFPCQ